MDTAQAVWLRRTAQSVSTASISPSSGGPTLSGSVACESNLLQMEVSVSGG